MLSVSCTHPNILPVVVSKNNLELSIILNTAFAAGFLKIILSFYNSIMLNFGEVFLGRITYELLRNSLNLESLFPTEACQETPFFLKILIESKSKRDGLKKQVASQIIFEKS